MWDHCVQHSVLLWGDLRQMKSKLRLGFLGSWQVVILSEMPVISVRCGCNIYLVGFAWEMSEIIYELYYTVLCELSSKR